LKGGTLEITGTTFSKDWTLAELDEGQVNTIKAETDHVTFSGILSGDGGFAKAGSKDLTLTGANTFTGATMVREGRLKLGANGVLDSSDHLILADGATFDTNSYAYSLAGKSLTVVGEGAQYLGNLNVSNGQLTFELAETPTSDPLTVTGTADISGSDIKVVVSPEAVASLTANQELTLIAANSLNSTGASLAINDVPFNLVEQASFAIGFDSAKLTAVMILETRPESKVFSEAYISGLAMITQAGDLAAQAGLQEAWRAAGSGTGTSVGGFAAVSAGTYRYRTGSHVNTNGVSAMAGLAWGIEASPGRITLGVFAEYGYGSYDTYNDFPGLESITGDGDTQYVGGGLLGQINFNDTGSGHFHLEASGRFGRVRNDFQSAKYFNQEGLAASFTLNTNYYGLHLGFGYVFEITDRIDLDLYAQYLWTRQDGKSVRLATGERIDFDRVDSSRGRLGIKLTTTITEKVRPFFGLSVENEFDGVARASSGGHAIKAPSMRGVTGVGELGLSIKPSQSSPVTIEFSAQGHLGKRQGLSGNLTFKLEF
jgi:autotransporter-associated beta strand protein